MIHGGSINVQPNGRSEGLPRGLYALFLRRGILFLRQFHGLWVGLDLQFRLACSRRRFRQGAEFLHFILRFLPVRRLLLGRDRRVWVAIKSQNIRPQLRADLLEVMLSQLVKQVGIGLIGQAVFTGAGDVARVKIGVLKVQVSGSCFVEKLGV